MEEKEKFLFEQPKDAKSWQEEAMKEVAALERVLKIECDICMFGLRVGRRLNKKPTGLMTNCEEIAEEMNKKCDHTHFHEPLEGSGKTRRHNHTLHSRVNPFSKASRNTFVARPKTRRSS